MSLEGTLETIALPDVLALLSVTAKTGELRIEAGGGVGSVWFDAGQLAGFDVGSHKTPVDAVFALLRLREGGFKFYTGTTPANAMAPQDVAPLLDEAENRLMQWAGIAAAVPSLYCDLSLQESVEGTVMLRPDQWSLVAAIGGGRKVLEVLDQRGLGEFDGGDVGQVHDDLQVVAVQVLPVQAADLAHHALVAQIFDVLAGQGPGNVDSNVHGDLRFGFHRLQRRPQTGLRRNFTECSVYFHSGSDCRCLDPGEESRAAAETF